MSSIGQDQSTTNSNAPTYRFVTTADTAFGEGGELYRSDQRRVDMTYHGPTGRFSTLSEAPEVAATDIEYGCFYWRCASLPAGRYWYIGRDNLGDSLQAVVVKKYGRGDSRQIVSLYYDPHFCDVLHGLRNNAVPWWVQEKLLGTMPLRAFAELVEFSGRAPLDVFKSSRFTRLSHAVWMYKDGERTLFADLMRGSILEKAALPRQLKKALNKSPGDRTPRQRRRIARLKVGLAGRWSGGFRVDEELSRVPFTGDLQATYEQMSALFHGARLISPSNLFGGMKYAILEHLALRGKLSYAEAYGFAAELFSQDDRLKTPVGSYRYDLLFHQAWGDVVFKIGRAEPAVAYS